MTPVLTDPRLIVGLDLPSLDAARAMVERLGATVSSYKIGLTLLARPGGVAFAHELKAAGKMVFQDWKLHDIGAQVEGAARAVAEGGCDLLTVHAEPQVMKGAVKGRDAAGSDTKLLAVTVMTSLSDADLTEIGYGFDAAALVERRVRQALECGVDGVVSSPLEATRARDRHRGRSPRLPHCHPGRASRRRGQGRSAACRHPARGAGRRRHPSGRRAPGCRR
jgi:orotidine-5'-phosphate decarboxylase